MLKKSIHFAAIFAIPTFIIFGSYYYFDPFRILKPNSTFITSEVPLNRDYVSTELFKKQFEKEKYNSFVFGSSRTIPIQAESWNKYLPENASIFKFDAAGENIYGIHAKIKFLNAQPGLSLNNCLIFICRDAFNKELNIYKHLNIKHPDVSGESWIRFHFQFLKMYLSFKFLTGYYYFKLTGNINSINEDIIQINKTHIDLKSNQIFIDGYEDELKKSEDNFYKKYEKKFIKTNETLSLSKKEKEGFNDQTIRMLKEIKEIMDARNTNYKIILSPLYDEIKFDSISLKSLFEIFPRERVFDFTGKNYITTNKRNWYENYHFRPFIGDSILKSAYSKEY